MGRRPAANARRARPRASPLAPSTRSDDEKDLLLHVPGDGLWGDLFHLALDGTEAGPMVPIEAGGPSHVWAKSLQWISGRRVLFMGDQDSPMKNQLYVADVAAPADPPVKLSEPLQPAGELTDFHMRGDPEHVTYYAQLGADTPYNLYRARIDPPRRGPPDQRAAGGGRLPVDRGVRRLGRRHAHHLRRLRHPGADRPVPRRSRPRGPGRARNVTSSLPLDVSLLGYLSPDASQVFFRARIPDEQRGPLYMVQLSPEIGQPVLLSDEGEWVNDFSVLAAQ